MGINIYNSIFRIIEYINKAVCGGGKTNIPNTAFILVVPGENVI